MMSQKYLRINVDELRIPAKSKLELIFSIPTVIVDENKLKKICEKESLTVVHVLRDDFDIYASDPLQRILVHSTETIEKDYIETYLNRVEKILGKILYTTHAVKGNLVSSTPIELSSMLSSSFASVVGKYTRGDKSILRSDAISTLANEPGVSRLFNYFHDLVNYRKDSDPVDTWNVDIEMMVNPSRMSHYRECVICSTDILKKYYGTEDVYHKLRIT